MKGYLLGIDPYGRPMFKVGGRQIGATKWFSPSVRRGGIFAVLKRN